MVDVNHFLWFCLVMASLKSFLFGLAPILSMTGAALYERQRVLTTLGVLEATPGRGPGSGVPLTADNIAAVLISVLAAENPSQIDDDVVRLCKARAGPTLIVNEQVWNPGNKASFKTEVGRVISGQDPAAVDIPFGNVVTSISVSRPWRGRITIAPDEIIEFTAHKRKPLYVDAITITAELEFDVLKRVIDFTSGALLSQLAEEEDDE